MEFKRETGFSQVVRSFFRSIATILGLAVGIVIVAFGLAMFMGPDLLPPKATPMIMPDGDGNRVLLPEHDPAILMLNFHGVIGMGDLTSEKMMNTLLDSQEGILGGGRVKAVFLHLNTPGGAAVDSDTIYRALMAYKQKHNIPIYAFVDGLCASGGMYIACAADKIYASPPSIIGSVGVLMGPNFNFVGTMEKYGVSALTLTEGKDKDELNPFRPWRPDEGASLKVIMASLYDRFVSIVAASRPQLTKKQLTTEYGAHVFIASEAEQLGYIDVANADYSDAMKELALAAHIKEGSPYQVIQLLPPRPFFSDFARAYSPAKIVRAVLGEQDLSELNGKFLYYYQP